MRKGKKIAIRLFRLLCFCVCGMSGLFSCEYEFIEEPLVDPNVTISFAADILPILNDNNNCTVCHRSGSRQPYFTDDYAYSMIVPALVDTLNPLESRFYALPEPSSAEHSFRKYSQTQAALVLLWIEQGAKNN